MAMPRVSYWPVPSLEDKTQLHFFHIQILYERIKKHAVPPYASAGFPPEGSSESEDKEIPNPFSLLQLNTDIYNLAYHITEAWLPTEKFINLLDNLAKTLKGDNTAREKALETINTLLTEKDQELKKMHPYLEPVFWGLLGLGCLALAGFFMMTLNPMATSVAVCTLQAILPFAAAFLCGAYADRTLDRNKSLYNRNTLFCDCARNVKDKLEDQKHTPEAMKTLAGVSQRL
jgi:hypothetical protein